MDEVVILWRPTGPEEMELVRSSGSTRWPPRLPEQPIFYPVLNEDYAIRIASDWNVKASGVGGGQSILEYWIPVEELENFNNNIVGLIEEVAVFR
jgi:hypothetical protein